MTEKIDFGSIGMAFSCTLFLEAALRKYSRYASSIDKEKVSLIHEWNLVLVSLLKDPRYKTMLGDIGNKLVKYTNRHYDFSQKCVDDAPDVNVQSLHYALRFQENIRFIDKKYAADINIVPCDIGCGLSPLTIILQNQYDLKDVYCIDIVPEIADLYTNASYQLTGKIPTFIDWDSAKCMSGKINTINSVGCFPHMSLDGQKEYIKAINKSFANFFIEIKYKKHDGLHNSENAFGLSDLQKLRVDVENVTDIETAMIKNSLSYLAKFVHARPNFKEFLVEQSRSLFLSR